MAQKRTPARKKKPTKPARTKTSSLLAGLLIIAVLGLAAGITALMGVDYFKRLKAPAGPAGTRERLARIAEDRLSESPLSILGEFAEAGAGASGAVRELRWVGYDEGSLTLAEKAVEDGWREVSPDIRVGIIYPEQSTSGERVRMVAGISKDPLVEVLLYRADDPLPKPRARRPEPADPPGPKPAARAREPLGPPRPNPIPAPIPAPSPEPKPEPKPEAPTPAPPVTPTPIPNPDPTPDPVPAPAAIPGRIVIIIDDIGHDLDALDLLMAIGAPLTYSVLPYDLHTGEAVARLQTAGVEYLLHLPMEPERYPEEDPGEGALLLGMGRDEIEKRMDAALAKVPGAKGMNNHMGSAFTTDRGEMEAVLAAVKSRGLFFIDSRTSGRSVGFELARELGIPAAERTVFLDHVATSDAVAGRLEELMKRARRGETVIAIGHPHPETIEALRRELPAMVRDGYPIVPVSEVVK